MKNNIIAFTLSIACVLASCLPSALTNFNHIETEEVVLEESADTPTWDILYKGNDEAMKAYQETYDRVYKETYENLTKTQEQVQANIQATNEANQQNIQSFIQDMVNSDWYKLIQANNEKVVKSISGDGKGNAIVTYSNGTKETVNIYSPQSIGKVTPTPKVNDYERVGYKLKCSNSTQNGTYYETLLNSSCSYDYYLENFSIELISINTENPSKKYKYQIKGKLTFDNHNDNIGVPSLYWTIDDNYNDNLYHYRSDVSPSTTSYTYIIDETIYSPIPYVEITYLLSSTHI